MNKDTNNANWKKNVSIYIGSQISSLFGSSIVDYAMLWYITLQTKSAMVMAIGTVCVYLPKIIVSLFSGTWADKYNRKSIIIYSDAGIAIVTLVFVLIFHFNCKELWVIFITLGIRSIGTGIQTPASNSVIPLIASKDKYMQINGIYNSLQSMIAILSPALSGILLSYLTLEVVVMVDVFTAIVAILILSKMKMSMKNEETSNCSYIKNLSISWESIKKNYIVKNLLNIYTLYFFLIVPISLLIPVKIVRIFGDEVWRLSMSEIFMSIGSVLGGLVIAKYGGIKYGFKIIGSSFMAIGLFAFMISTSNFVYFLIAVFLIGSLIALSNSSTVSLLQVATEQRYQGRIFGFVQIFTTGANLVGMIFFGILGDIMSIDIIFSIIAILFILFGVYIYILVVMPNDESDLYS